MLTIEKLEALGAKTTPIREQDKNEAISKIHAEIGSLPDDYLELLRKFGGDIQFSGDVVFSSNTPSPWADSDQLDQIDFLYGLTSSFPSSSLLEVAETYKDRLPNGWIPIGAAPGGNQICMNLNNRHEIAFWDHESEGIPVETRSREGLEKALYPIADSLSDFIGRLHLLTTPLQKLNVKVDLRF